MSSEELKAQADAAYRASNLRKAHELYEQALAVDPTSIPILSNLSATEYELGQYTTSLSNSTRVVVLIIGAGILPGQHALLAKNRLRACRSLIALKQHDGALERARELAIAPEADRVPADIKTTALSLLGVLNHMAGLHAGSEDGARARISSFPVYRPAARPAMEYYTVSSHAYVISLIRPFQTVCADWTRRTNFLTLHSEGGVG